MTILLAEDEEMLRRLLCRALRDRGYQVIETGGGAEALTAAAQHQGCIDLLLTDLVMPGLDGRQLAARLGAERPDTKVLFISGQLGQADLEPGAAFLGKPFTPAELELKIRSVLDTDPCACQSVG